MVNFLRRLRRKARGDAVLRQAFDSPIAPDEPFFAIGDLHGSLAHLDLLLQKISQKDADAKLVFVGDYVDRGDASAGVLQRLYDLQTGAPDQVICLAGNHEAMLLDFVDAPEKYGRRWLRHGGLQTVASFGVQVDGRDMAQLREDLSVAIGPDLLSWLSDLPLQWRSGNMHVLHAAADPLLPMDHQTERTLLWGHESFLQIPRQDGAWVIHGHTIVDAAGAKDGRISVDTGAYATGVLTAAYVATGGVDFLQT